MHDLMIWCTCAEVNKKMYLERIAHWYEQVKDIFGKFDPDVYVFVDGVIAGTEMVSGPIFINQAPALGRKSVEVFPGWKRSLTTALEFGKAYKFIIHFENDVRILKSGNILRHMTYPGMFVGICKKYGFIETAFMILNDRDVNRRIVEHYADGNNLFETEFAEEVISRIAGDAINLVFETDRVEDKHRFNLNYDFVCQYTYESNNER